MCYEEAVEYFKVFSIAQTTFRKDLYGTAIKAIEKQIPKNVTKVYQQTHKPILFKCPNCSKDVLGSGFYCWHCGQAIKWEEQNEK